MVRSLTSLVVALAVLVPGVAWPSPSMQGAGAGAHACCLLMKMEGCAGTTISCCPAPERGRESTPPSSSSAASASALDQAQHASHLDGTPRLPAARVLAFGAHAHARANAPPGPLYLKHLTLLV
jgi:hypothetical protein